MGVVPQQPFFCDGFDLSADFKPLFSPRVNDIFSVFEKKSQSHTNKAAKGRNQILSTKS
jgi:hypothetical protein